MRTLANETIWEVPVKGGGTRHGTERELDQIFRGSDWRSVARKVTAQATRNTTYDNQIIEQDMDFADDPPRSHTSVKTYAPVQGKPRFRIEDHATVIPRRAHAAPPQTNAPVFTDDIDERPKRQKRPRRLSIWFYIGVGMIAMLALFVAGSWAYDHWQSWRSYSTYGYPPTYQIDAVVGHNGDSKANPSHFIFLNLHGHPEVIEIPAGDETKQKTYLLPELVTDGFDTIPITGFFADVNGDGKPDMIVQIQDQRLVLINTGDGFRPLKPGEHITLPSN